MEQRDIILTPFPFSNLQGEKLRPSVIISNDKYNKKFQDIIIVPLTSVLENREYAILLTNKDLEKGKIIKDSKIKVDRIFSINKGLVKFIIGKINLDKFEEIKKIIFDLL